MKLILTKTRKHVCVTFAVIVSACCGCGSDNLYILTEDDLEWVVYDLNETMKFQNSSGAKRTYSVPGKWRGEGNFACTIAQQNDSIRQSVGKISIIRDGTGLSVNVTWPHHPVTFTPTSLIPVTDSLDGIAYNDVYISVTANTDSIDNIEKVHYSKSAGVIKFFENTGMEWRLIK